MPFHSHNTRDFPRSTHRTPSSITAMAPTAINDHAATLGGFVLGLFAVPEIFYVWARALSWAYLFVGNFRFCFGIRPLG